ncbi:helix-turn-helix domain-containing protein [Nocardioides sp. KIGAM211]|uniref:Helix-turn-helix domain-containing protein n=1 Tax=Nocardioides luti TaxID=2761101 RepID=A0A7X0RHK4_9ACTN|nr:helix-turn-helix domain-containing protein [Nocardioides luti]
MRAATLAFLAEHRRARVDVLTDRLVATIEASNPGYRATRVVPRADLRSSCHDNIVRVLELLDAAVDGRGTEPGSAARDPAYDAARATGRRRAEQGLPLDDVLRSFRMGGRLIWDDLVEQARSTLDADELREVGTRVWEVVDETSAQVAAAYHATERAAVRADEQLRAELWEGVLSGRAKEPGFAHEAARILDVPVDGDYLVATGVDLDTARLEHALGSRPNVWVRRSGGAVGLVALGADGPDDVLATLAVDDGGSIGVSVGVEGLAGVDTGFRQAVLALRTLGGRPGVAAFDDRLPEALLLTSPEVAGRLVAVWLGPVLALPPAEGGPLLDTLTAWVGAGGSTTHTAEAVHCHRNTVINRLRRVGDLTGQVLLDGVPPLELALAVRSLAIGRVR